MMGDAGLIDIVVRGLGALGQVFARHPAALAAFLVAAFAIGWAASWLWDALRPSPAQSLKLGAVVLGGAAVAALLTVIPTALVAVPSCAPGDIIEPCDSRRQAYETCSQRHDDWQRWQRCVTRRAPG